LSVHEKINVTALPIGIRPSQRTLEDVARALVDERVAAAHARGLAAGLEQLQASGAQALQVAAQRIEEAREQALDALAEQSVELAIEIARAVLRREINAGNYDLEKIVREALSCSGVERGSCTVHLHPEDYAQLQDVSFRSGTDLEADTHVARGDVHVSTPRGMLVRETDAALDDIRSRLKEQAAG